MTPDLTPNATPADGALARPSLVVNALSNWATLAVTVLVGFFLTPIVIAHVGRAGYGVWTLVATLVGYYGLLDLGISAAVVRYVARDAGRGDRRALSETASTAMAVFVGVGLAVGAVSLWVGAPLARFFSVADADLGTFARVVWLMGAATALSFPSNVFSGVARAHERFVALNLVVIGSTLARAGLTVWALWSGYGLVGVAGANAAVAVLALIANAVLCRVMLPHVRFRPSLFRRSVLRSLIGFGAVATVITVADLLRFKLDSVVLAKFRDMDVVAVYGVAALLIHYMLTGVTAGLGVLTPRFASLAGQGTDGLRDLFVRSLSISAALGFGAGMLMVCFGGPFVRLWVGDTFRDAIPVLWILGTSYAVALAQAPGISVMYALNRHGLYALTNTLEGVANVVLSLALVSRYGIVGVVLGTAVPQLLHKGLVQPVYVSRLVGAPLGRYVLACVPGLVAGAAIVGGVVVSGVMPRLGHNWAMLFVEGAAAAGLFVAVWWGLTVLVRRSGGRP